MNSNLAFNVVATFGFLILGWYLYSVLRTPIKSKIIANGSLDYQALDTNADATAPSLPDLSSQAIQADESSILLKKEYNESPLPPPKLLSINYKEIESDQDDYEIEVNLNLKNYFNALSWYIKQTSKSIYILDYVAHGKEMDKTEDFFIKVKLSYENYFADLEELIKNNKQIKYVRILQLPVNTVLSSFQEILKYAIDNLYGPTRKHIYSVIGEKNFELYVIPCAARLHSEIIIDKKTWLIELDTYDRARRAKPDCLFTNRADEGDEIARAIEDEQRLLDSIISSHRPVGKKQLSTVVKHMLEELDMKREMLEEKKQSLEKGTADDLIEDLSKPKK